MVICKYCNKKFVSNSVLKTHIKTAKYCIKIQEEKDSEEIGMNILEEDGFKCDFCDKILNSKRNLEVHQIKCKTKSNLDYQKIINDNNILKEKLDKISNDNIEKDKIIFSLKSQLEIYKSDHECIQEIAKQPKTTNNNISNKFLNISPFIIDQKQIKEKIDTNLTRDIFLEGQRGIAELTYNYLLLDEENKCKYICNDPARNVFSYKTEDGEIEKDYKADKITNLIYKDVVNKSSSISKDIIKNEDQSHLHSHCIKSMSEIKNLKKDNSKYASRLSVLVNRNKNLLNEEIEEEENNESHEEEYSDLQELTNEYIKDCLKFLTIEHIQNGVNGFAEYAMKYPFKDRIYCSNLEDNILKYKIDEEIITDIGGVKICQKLFKHLRVPYLNLFKDFKENIYDKIDKYNQLLPNDMTDDQLEIANIETEKINEPLDKLIEQQKEILDTTKGIETEFLFKFIKQICIETCI